MQPIITENRERIAELCRQHHVRRLSVFGSAVRDDFDPSRSDIDLLVEFESAEGREEYEVRSLLQRELVQLFHRPVDLIQEGSVRNPYIRHAIQTQRETLYAA